MHCTTLVIDRRTAALANFSPRSLKLFDEDYWPLHSKTLDHLRRLQDLQPQTMLCMHGSSFKGERCADMLRALGALRAEADARARKQAMAV